MIAWDVLQDWIKYTVVNDTDFDFSEYGLEHLELMDSINPDGIATSRHSAITGASSLPTTDVQIR